MFEWINIYFIDVNSWLVDTHCSKSSFFVQKFNLDFPRKLSIFLGWKIGENVVVWGFLAVDNFDFTRKIVKKNLDEKLVKMLGFCQNWIFGQKFDFSNSVLPRSWTGCGIVDCPEFVMIDTINGAVQSEINSQWLKMTKNVSFFVRKLQKKRLLQGVLTSFRPLKVI